MYKLTIYSFIALGALATACTSTDTADELLADGVAVKFTARADSRASVTTNTNITDNSFAVYGDMVPTTSASSATPTVIFNGTPVTYSGGAWQYGTPQYWFPAHTHSFVALHPAGALTGANPTYQNNQLSFTYTLPAYSATTPTAYRDTPDILVATHRRRYTSPVSSGTDGASPVAFNFTHILARINFTAEVKTDQQQPIVIESFTIHNVHTSATYSVTPANLLSDPQTDDYSGQWTDHAAIPAEGNQLLRFPVVTTVEIAPGASRPFFRVDNNPLFVIPQTVPEEIEVRIRYSAGEKIVEETAMLQPFTLAHGGEWLPGKSYNYTFAIGVDTDITFKAPTVENWTESLGGNYIIPD